ncbi:MAG: sulfotransferase [Gemmatimonadales bacterium]
MIYVVLGIGFSGTTLISELLHHSGVAMIDGEMDRYDSGGKYEHPGFQGMNKALLGLTNDQVTQLHPQQCPAGLSSVQRDRMLELVHRQTDHHENWGFKDPRTVVTYPLWRDVLPPHKSVAIYRDPAGSWPRHRWQGYRRRYVNAWRACGYLRRWCEYHEAILRYAEDLGENLLLLNYERMMVSDEELARLRDFVSRDIEDRRRCSMYRSRSTGEMPFRLIRAVMDKASRWRPQETMSGLETHRAAQIDGNSGHGTS